jgi:hypothetical protein
MSMHYCQQGRVKRTHWVVQCKRCAKSIPAGVTTIPRDNQTVKCPLCAELRRYRPSEVFLGIPDHSLSQGDYRGSANRPTD